MQKAKYNSKSNYMKRIIFIILSLSVLTAATAQRKQQRKRNKAKTTVKKAAVPKVNSAVSTSALTVLSKDTSKPGTVTITSAYKPSLRSTAKINFIAATPIIDSAKPELAYNIPAQNLFFSYQPIPLQPLALEPDSSVEWKNHSYIKAGFGNYSSPYLEAGYAYGDGINKSLAAIAKHSSAKGSLPFQQYSKTGLDIKAVAKDKNNHEWTGNLYFDHNNQFQYGYEPKTLMIDKDSLRRRFTTIGLRAGAKNISPNSYGFSYHPTLDINFFSDNRKAREFNVVADAPFTKELSGVMALSIGLKADITSYKTDVVSVNNNIFYVQPAVSFKTPNLSFVAGITPSWNNSEFKFLPNISFESKLKDERFILQAGFVGYYNKTNYRSLATVNPFLNQPTLLANTRNNEIYAGIKGAAGNHLFYSAKASFIRMNAQPLFVNDTITGQGFNLAYEPEMNNFRVRGEIGYTAQEKFSILAALTFNQYSGLNINEKAWHLPPVEITGSLRWKVLKDLLFKSDLYFFEGPQYLVKTGVNKFEAAKLRPGVDLNAGVEFTVLPQVSLWAQFSNILNNKYQRWNQYEVLGFQFLGGIIYQFK